MGRKAENPHDIDVTGMPEDTLRVVQLLQSLNQPAADFARSIGEKPQLLNGMLKRKTRASLTLMQKIKDTYPMVNPEWLFTGEGDMFGTIMQSPTDIEVFSTAQVVGQAPLDLAELSKSQLIALVEKLRRIIHGQDGNKPTD